MRLRRGVITLLAAAGLVTAGTAPPTAAGLAATTSDAILGCTAPA